MKGGGILILGVYVRVQYVSWILADISGLLNIAWLPVYKFYLSGQSGFCAIAPVLDLFLLILSLVFLVLL